MIRDIKRMDLYRIILDEITIDSVTSAVYDVLGFLPPPNKGDGSEWYGNIESINIAEQVECTLEAHHGTWPDTYPIYFMKKDDSGVKMEIAWFRFVLNRKI